MAQKKQKSIGRRPTKADMKLLDKNIARYERQGWDSQVKGMKRFKKEQIAKMKRTDAVSRIDKALAENKKSSKKVQKARGARKVPGKMAKLKPGVAKLYREASQKQSKRAIRDAVKITKKLAKKVPYVAAVIIARDVVKGISKATCSKRGGKWVSGKCKGAKKDTRKITSPQVRDPISKR